MTIRLTWNEVEELIRNTLEQGNAERANALGKAKLLKDYGSINGGVSEHHDYPDFVEFEVK